MKKMFLVLTVFALLTATALTPILSVPNPIFALSITKIIFNSDRDGNDEIYMMDTDGTNVIRLTNNPANDGFPVCSPDGTKIAFLSTRDGNWEIYIMNSDGTDQTRLTSNSASDWYPSFSPDGKRIAFASTRDGNWEIYTMNIDGTNQTRVTNNPADDYDPSWSPDGAKFVFNSNRTGNLDLYIMNTDGSSPVNITNTATNDWAPRWSPDGNKIAFIYDRIGNIEVYTINVDGSDPTNLTDNPADDAGPVWSPDSTKIAFLSIRDDNWEIYVMDSDGTNQTRLTNNNYLDHYPSWLIFEQNQSPGVHACGPYYVNEGSSVILTAIGSDPDGDALTYAWDLDNDGIIETSGQVVSFEATMLDGPNVSTVTVKVTDTGGLSATDQAVVNILNVAPSILELTTPVDPFLIHSELIISAFFSDPGIPDIHTAAWDWGDGTVSPGSVTESEGEGTVIGSHTYDTPGVYTLGLMITDDDGGTASIDYKYIVIYDPEGGFITGGGWINSPPGAYYADTSLTGRANFGFVSKYKKGSNIPTGQTEFQFKVADLNFLSDSYQWMVIAGSKAMYKGTGTINGTGAYGFMLSAIDAALTPSTDTDLFRIKIWDKATDTMIYDNMLGAAEDADPTTAIGGGSIVVHK